MSLTTIVDSQHHQPVSVAFFGATTAMHQILHWAIRPLAMEREVRGGLKF